MNFKKDFWTLKDGVEFQKYLQSISRSEKIEWSKNILKTKMPVLAILSPEIKKIVKELEKGNFISFLNLWLWEYYENTIINGLLISKIKDFKTYKIFLLKYANFADCWATCDILKFEIDSDKEADYFNLANLLIKSKKSFSRRIGINIYFKYISDDIALIKIFKILDGFYGEKDYYVNMAIAWFIAECFIKKRDITLNFLKNNSLNNFIINKAIQKCRDSFRVSSEDKDMLLAFKR